MKETEKELKKVIDFDLKNGEIHVVSTKLKQAKLYKEMISNDHETLTEDMIKLAEILKQRKGNQMSFDTAMRTGGKHILFRGDMFFENENRCVILIDKLKEISIDSYLDFMNEVKRRDYEQ